MTFVSILVTVLVFGPPLILAPVFLFLCAVGFFGPNSPFRVRQRFECPVQHRAVTADFSVPLGAAQPASVLSCSAFREPGRVTCAQRCLDSATVRWAPPLGVFALSAGALVGADARPWGPDR